MSADKHEEKILYAKVFSRLLPILVVCYIVAFLDRVNIGFAKLQMQTDLAYSDAVYGLGAGIFFLGYVLFEVPSNLALAKFGARRWIARIMISWGILSMSFAFVSGETSFYILRFLLGVAEAGFFPGVILYLSQWFPQRYRAVTAAIFYTAIPISAAIGSPVSGLIMAKMAGLYRMSGWQWLFILEGIPSIVCGIWVVFRLTNSVRDAAWLSTPEKDLIERNIVNERCPARAARIWQLMAHPVLWIAGLVNFTIQAGIYGVSFWLPQLVRNTGIKDVLEVGLLSAIPWLITIPGMLFPEPLFGSAQGQARVVARDVLDRRCDCVGMSSIGGQQHDVCTGCARDCGDRHHDGAAGVLDDSDRHARAGRSRGRDRVRQFDRKSRRICRALRRGLVERIDRKHGRRLVRSRGHHDDRSRSLSRLPDASQIRVARHRARPDQDGVSGHARSRRRACGVRAHRSKRRVRQRRFATGPLFANRLDDRLGRWAILSIGACRGAWAQASLRMPQRHVRRVRTDAAFRRSQAHPQDHRPDRAAADPALFDGSGDRRRYRHLAHRC